MLKKLNAGFSVVEILLAAALFMIFASGAVGVIIQGHRMNLLSQEQAIANQYASEGIEAIRSIKNQNFTTISTLNATYCTTGAGIQRTGNVWALRAAGTNDIFNSQFTRTIRICDVQRDGSGNIVASGGTNDPNTKKVTSTVTWQAGLSITDSVALVTYETNWKKKKGGMLVYGNGGTTSDAVAYRLWSGDTQTWGTAGSVADIDGTSTNRVLRTVRVYSSSTRDEKIMIGRFYNGTTQYIYGAVWNGTSWGNVQLLSNWNAATFLDVRNFDGTYLSNGDFMTVFSDNTTTPKFRTWNGTAWSGQVSTQVIGGIPNYIVASARPGTNEVMAAFFDQSSDTNTQYFSGASYVTGSWTLHTEHAAAAPLATKQFVDFAWSPNSTTRGAVVYADAGSDRAINIKIWTANGSGSGSWTATANTANQTSNLGALSVIGRPGADEFVACDKDANATPRIICYESSFTPTWSNPTNQTIVTGTDASIQRSFDIGFEQVGGTDAIIVYSDNTGVPKLKRYNAGTNTWDASATSISTTPFSPGVFESVRISPREDDDIMAVMMDTNQDLYTAVWDIANDVIFTTPSGKAFAQHGTNGSADTEFWADFEWDKF